MGPTAPLWHPNAWRATGYLWFLAFVIYFYAAAPLLRRLPGWTWWTPVAAFLGSMVVTDPLAERLLYFAGFFFAGALAAQHPHVLERAVRHRPVVVVSAVAATGLAMTAALTDVQYDARFAVGSLAGIVVAIAWARSAQGAAWARPVRAIGRSSLVYYVSHFPVILAVVAVCEALGVRSAVVIAVAAFPVALGVGAVLSRWRRTRPLVWLFEAPWPRPRPVVAPPMAHAA